MAAGDCTYTNSASTALTLNGSTYYLRRPGPQGIYGITPEVIVADIPTKLPVGVFQANNVLKRGIVLPITVIGSSGSDLVTQIRALTAALWVDVRDDKQGTLTYIAPNNNTRYIKCSLQEGFDVGEWLGGGWADKNYANIDIPLLCPDPTFYGATVNATPSAFTGTTPVTVSCANAGDADAYPTITYTGIVNNPKATDAYGHFVKLEIVTTHANDEIVLVLDPQNLSMTYTPNGGAATTVFGYRTEDSTLTVCKYGTNNLSFVGEDAGDNATIEVSFASRYSSHG